MKVRIIPEKCIACGLCQTYSALFDYDDEGIVVLANTDAKEMTDLLDEGIRNIDKEELKAKLNEIYNRNRQLVEDYSADIDIGGVSIISLAWE